MLIGLRHLFGLFPVYKVNMDKVDEFGLERNGIQMRVE